MLSARDLDEFVGGRVLIQRDDRYAATMRFVPYGARFYLADSLLLGDNKLVHGLQPVYLEFRDARAGRIPAQAARRTQARKQR